MGQCETLQIIQNLQNTFAHLAQRLLGPFYLHVLFYSAKTPTGNETTSGLSSSRSMRNFSRIGRWLEQALKAFGSSAFDTRQCDFWNKIKSITFQSIYSAACCKMMTNLWKQITRWLTQHGTTVQQYLQLKLLAVYQVKFVEASAHVGIVEIVECVAQ